MLRRLPLCVSIALVIAGMLAMSGCGVRGSLDTPPNSTDVTGSANPGTPAKSGEPHRPSILDPLIR
jgi:predicted small lipoprotein YifL